MVAEVSVGWAASDDAVIDACTAGADGLVMRVPVPDGDDPVPALARVYRVVLDRIGPDFDITVVPTTETIGDHGVAVLGGTFDHLHAGHKLLLGAAMWAIRGSESPRLFVGLTTDAMLKNKAFADALEPYDARVSNVITFCKTVDPRVLVTVVPLNDMFGPSLRSDVDVLIVSRETESGAAVVNEKRVQLGERSIPVVVVDTIGVHGSMEKLSSTAIRRKIVRNRHLQTRWSALMTRLGVSETMAKPWFERVCTLYESAGRHYHTLEHIDAMLRSLDEYAAPEEPRVVELAVWFHDCIYDVFRSDNEERSADLADQFAAETGIDPGIAQAVRQFIVATKSHDLPGNASHDMKLFLDLDMAILGSPPDLYVRYANAIWLEYQPAYSREAFIAGRTRLLRNWLAKPALYHSTVVHDRLDAAARKNIENELVSLNLPHPL